MPRRRGFRVRPRGLPYERAALHRDEAWRTSRSVRMRSRSSAVIGPWVVPGTVLTGCGCPWCWRQPRSDVADQRRPVAFQRSQLGAL